MTNTENAIAKLQAHALALTGMKSAPTTPTNADNVIYPFAITFDKRGSLLQESAGYGFNLCTLVTEIHVANGIMGLVIPLAMSFSEPFMQKLINDPKLGGTVDTTNDIRYTFGRLGPEDTDDIGYVFEIDVKIKLTGTS